MISKRKGTKISKVQVEKMCIEILEKINYRNNFKYWDR